MSADTAAKVNKMMELSVEVAYVRRARDAGLARTSRVAARAAHSAVSAFAVRAYDRPHELGQRRRQVWATELAKRLGCGIVARRLSSRSA